MYIVNLKKVGKSVLSNCLRCTKVRYFRLYETLYAIWYHLCNFKNVINIHGVGLLLLALTCNFTESNTPS